MSCIWGREVSVVGHIVGKGQINVQLDKVRAAQNIKDKGRRGIISSFFLDIPRKEAPHFPYS